MKTNKVLDKLKITNEEILLEFFIIYSRLEYALKRTNFTKTNDGDAEANWEKFISKNKSNFDSQKSERLKQAVDYLLSFPAQKQIIKDGKLDFVEHPGTKSGPELCRVYHCIRMTRNNLFHGGKFPYKPVKEPSRNKKLIESCLIVLKEIIELDKRIENMFWEKI